MKLDTAFESVPDDDDLLYSIEHWDEDRIEAEREKGNLRADGLLEAFVHPRTGTAARIIESEKGNISAQASMGDFADYDNVMQSGDPSTLVSGGASVIALDLDTISEARAIAYYWLHGWVMRNSSVGDSEGDIYDSEA